MSTTRVTATLAARGKKTAHTDTYGARFARLVPGELVVEVDESDTADPALGGAMTTTVTLRDTGAGTEVTAVHEGVPDGIAPEQNEEGWRTPLARLARLLEG